MKLHQTGARCLPYVFARHQLVKLRHAWRKLCNIWLFDVQQKCRNDIFKVPKESDNFKKKWASELKNVITKDRVIDSELQEKINDKEHRKMWICERHFSPQQYWVYSNSKKIKGGELPTLNIPKKSIDSLTSPPRITAAISKREEFQQLLEFSPPSTPSNAYKDFSDFRKRVSNLSLGETWKVQWIERIIVVKSYVLPKFDIFVEDSLYFTIRVFGWMLMDGHEFYTKYQRSFLNVTFSKFIVDLAQLQLFKLQVLLKLWTFKNTVPKTFDYFSYQTSAKTKLHQVELNRSESCSLLVPDLTQPCRNCKSLNVRVTSEINRKNANLEAPAKLKTPIKFTSSEKIKLTLLQSQIDKMKSALDNCSQKDTPELNNDLISLFSDTDQQKIPPFMKLFWGSSRDI